MFHLSILFGLLLPLFLLSLCRRCYKVTIVAGQSAWSIFTIFNSLNLSELNNKTINIFSVEETKQRAMENGRNNKAMEHVRKIELCSEESDDNWCRIYGRTEIRSYTHKRTHAKVDSDKDNAAERNQRLQRICAMKGIGEWRGSYESITDDGGNREEMKRTEPAMDI